MRRFLYFLPLPGANRGILAERGLLSRFTESPGAGDDLLPHVVSGIDAGPDGQRGCIVALGNQPAPYDVREQFWQPSSNGKFWVGAEKINMPRPEDLERNPGLKGEYIALLDRNAWRSPVILRWDAAGCCHEINLPQSLAPSFENGKCQFKKQVRPPFAATHALAEQIFNDFGNGATISIEEAVDRAARLLGMNYRIGIEEIGLLGLLDNALALKILATAIDLETINAQARALSTQGQQLADGIDIQQGDG